MKLSVNFGRNWEKWVKLRNTKFIGLPTSIANLKTEKNGSYSINEPSKWLIFNRRGHFYDYFTVLFTIVWSFLSQRIKFLKNWEKFLKNWEIFRETEQIFRKLSKNFRKTQKYEICRCLIGLDGCQKKPGYKNKTINMVLIDAFLLLVTTGYLSI